MCLVLWYWRPCCSDQGLRTCFVRPPRLDMSLFEVSRLRIKSRSRHDGIVYTRTLQTSSATHSKVCTTRDSQLAPEALMMVGPNCSPSSPFTSTRPPDPPDIQWSTIFPIPNTPNHHLEPHHGYDMARYCCRLQIQSRLDR